MPNLLHVMHFIPRGTRSIDHFILSLSRRLGIDGWQVRFAFEAEPPAEFRDALIASGARYVIIPFPFTRASARSLIQQLDSFRPDVTQTSFLSPFNPHLLRMKLNGFTKKLVVIDHSSGAVAARSGWKRWLTVLRGKLVGRVVDAIVPVSAAIARRDVEDVCLPSRKVTVVYNGIKIESFRFLPRSPRDPLLVVYAGQLIPEKGVLTLLQAHGQLRRSGVSNYELRVAGKGPQEPQLNEFCKSNGLDDVRFLGHVDSIPELFASADIVVVPSIWYEAFGLVLAEAMACGAACLVSDAGALSEVAGGAGLVFQSGNPDDLAARLKQLLVDAELRRSLGAAGRKRVETEFTLERMVDGHIAVCESVLRGELAKKP